jgi:starch synthase (maltosyl-transferring)
VPAAERAAGSPGRDVIVTIVSLDHLAVQSGWVELDLEALGVDPTRPYAMHDLLTGATYQWEGRHNFVLLDPAGLAAHLFSLEQPAVPAALGGFG